MKNNFIILIIILSIAFSFSSCNAVKYVPEDEHLLTSNAIIVNDKKNVKEEITDYIVQRPNQFVLGIPLPLHVYNVGNKNFETDFEKWKEENPKKFKNQKKLFSEKQARAIRKFKYNSHQWWLKNGEAPVILDLKKTNQTVANLTQHYFNEGYFKAKVTSEFEFLENKKAKVNYIVNTNKVYTIDSISTRIKSPVLDSIYNTSKSKTLLASGEPFKLSSFVAEQNRITNLFRNSGVYRFNRNAITFEADSSNFKSNVELIIGDSIANVPYKVQKVKKINIYPDYSFITKDDPIKDSINYKGYTFYTQDKLKYKPRFLLNAIYIDPNTLYKDDARETTRQSLRNLKNFRSVDIKYTELENDELEASIYLTPLKKFGLGFNAELTHSNIRQLGTLAKISFSNRNIFKGADILKFSIQGSFIDSKDAADNEKLLNAWEIGADIALELPRFLIPFKKSTRLTNSLSPKTTFSLGTSLQKNIGLDKQRFTGIVDYTWKSSSTANHSFEIFNTQFIKNLNPDQYFYIYTYEYSQLEAIQSIYFPDYPLTKDNALQFIEENIDESFEAIDPEAYETAINIEARYGIITENAFVPTMAYTYTYNNRKDYKDNDFSFFRARIASSGALTTAIFNEKDENGVKTLFNTPIAQYIRTDFEYKKFWELSLENIMAFRVFLGVAVPYGNSETIPFSRNYFIGGPNDLRAWKVYDLGPGATNTGLEYNVGNLKFLTSLEYRFEILNSLKGALFMDAGNIWDITNSTLTPPEAKFTSFKSLESIALGSGFGIRYDLSFILLRLDLGFKTYEPYLPQGKKWFHNYNFANAVYNFGISYPF